MTMTDNTLTYTFDGDEIFAIHEGSVIASGTNFSKVEETAVDYLDSLNTTRKSEAKAKAKKKATHIITPNGVKGEILGRVATVWGETVTARFENGRIVPLEIHGEDYEWVSERTASYDDPTARLAATLEEDFDRDVVSLTKRANSLRDLAIEARRLIANGAPYPVEVKLDQIKIAAETEIRSIKEAIDHLVDADTEAYTAPTPQVVEQADLGTGAGNSWLDVTTQEMIDESEGQDLDKVLQEGPAMFVTDLETGALADTGTTRELALSHIVGKTSGFQGEEIEDFRNKFVARVEVARRHELAARKATTKKEAAATEEVQANVPDDAIFM